MRKFLALAVTFGLAAFAASAEIVKADSRGGLRAQVVVTDNANKLAAMAGKQDKTPLIRNKQAVRARKNLSVSTLVSGLSVDKDGKCDAAVSYRVYSPDEQVVVEETNFAVITGKLLDPQVFVMAQPAYTLALDRRAPKGPYFIEAVVLDKISNRTALSRQRVILE